ncbi:MAG: MFS transporter [Ferroplasma sp.]
MVAIRSIYNHKLSGIAGTSVFSFYMNSMLRFFIPVLLPFLIVSLNITVYLGSLLITAYWIGYTAMQIPSGIIADRIGLARTAKIAFILMGAIFSLFYFFRSYSSIFIIQLLLGSLSATVFVADASLIQKAVSHRSRAIFVGIYQEGFFIGASLGEFIILKTFSISFNFAFYFILAFLIVAAAFNFIYMIEPDVPRSDKRGKIDRRIVYVAMIRFAASFVYIGFITLFTTFIVYDSIVPYSSAYIYAWIPAAGGLLSSPLGGMVSRKLKKGKSIVSVFSVIALASDIMYINYAPVEAIFILSFITGIFYGLYAGPSMSMASDFSGSDRNLAASSGILNFSAQVGGTISPLIIGFLFSIYGNFDLAFEITGIISIIILIVPLIKLEL